MGTIDFDQLFTLYSRRLHYIAYSVIKDRYLAEDVVQETFIKAYKKIDTIEDIEKMGAWLSAIAARTAIDFLRSEKRKNLVLADESIIEQMNGHCATSMNTEEEVDARLFKDDLNRSMEQLSAEYQAVLVLKVEHGLKENEIASLLQLKSATVKTRLYRARKKLKQAFAERETA
jgi:RNA polymerase sigma factor (sigma-70 family)